MFHPYEGGVIVHYSEYITIKVNTEAVLQVWRDKSRLWRVTIKYKVDNDDKYFLLIDRTTPQDAIHTQYV